MLHNSYINNGNVFLKVLGAEMAKVEAESVLVRVLSLLPRCRLVLFFFLLCPHMGERKIQFPAASFIGYYPHS